MLHTTGHRLKQIEQLISVLEQRFRIKVEDFIHLYTANESGEAICQALGLTENGLRTIAKTLNLRMPKKYRQNDITLYYSRFTDSEVNLKLHEVTGDLDASYKDAIKLERQLLHTKRELQKYKSQALRSATDIDLQEVMDAVLSSVRPVRPVNVQIRTPSTHYADYTQFIMLSDMHCEETVSSDDVGNVNEYNWEEFERRLAVVFNEALQAYRGERKCILMSGGDQLSGLIHDTLETTGKPTGKAVADLAKVLADYTNVLASVYEEVEIMGVTGNHGRLSDNRKSHANGFNLEYMMFQLWEALTIKENVVFNFGTSGYALTNIGGMTLALHHGDYHRSGGGIPRTLKVQEIIRQTTGVIPEHIFQGHLHMPALEMTPQGGVYLTNGCMIGSNSYAHSNGFVAMPWNQTIGSFLPNGVLENSRLVTG